MAMVTLLRSNRIVGRKKAVMGGGGGRMLVGLKNALFAMQAELSNGASQRWEAIQTQRDGGSGELRERQY